MSNYRFIQVDPPKEELTLPANIIDFREELSVKTEDSMSLKFISTVATFTGVVVGDLLEIRNTDKETLVEKSLGIVEVGIVVSANEIETITYDTSYKSNLDLINNFRAKESSEEVSKLYKLPTNNFSLQIKSDNIVRYYEDPVDKTIMYIDLVNSNSICSSSGTANTYGEFQDYGGVSVLALTTAYADWTSGSIGLNSNITLTSSPNKFTIITPGIYKITSAISVSSSAANRTLTFAIHKNGAELPETVTTRGFQSSGASGSISMADIIEFAAGDEVTLAVKADAATNMTINNITTTMTLVSSLGTTACSDVWEHDRSNLNIVTLNNTDKLPFHNIVPYLNSIFLGE